MKHLILLTVVLMLAGSSTPSIMADRKSHGEGINVRHAWVRPTPPGMTITAAYFKIYNDGKKADRLIAVSSSAANTVELHEVIRKDGMMHMQPVKGGLDLPLGGVVVLEPGVYHLMLIGLKKPVKLGDKLEIIVTFKHSPALRVIAVAKNSEEGMSHHKMGSEDKSTRHHMK